MSLAVNGIIPGGFAVGGKTQVMVAQNGAKIWEAKQNTYEFVPPFLMTNTMGKLATQLAVYGKSEQDGVPDPDNPVEILSVGGEMGAQGKNLFDGGFGSIYGGVTSETIDGITTITSIYTAKRTAYWLTAPELAAGTYTISHNDDNDDNDLYYEINAFAIINGSVTFTITEPKTVNILCFVDAGAPKTFANIQLELGTTATDYAPYVAPSIATIPALRGVGDAHDVLWVDHGEGRAWGEQGCTGLLELTADITSIYKRMTNHIRFGASSYAQGYSSGVINGEINCNYLPWPGGTNYGVNNSCIFWHGSNNDNFYISFSYEELGITADDDDETALSAVNAWLDNCDPPFKVIYQLATPIIEELDYDDYKLLTADNDTTVTMTGDVMPEVHLTTYVSAVPDAGDSYLAQVLESLGVEPADTIEGQEEQLETLGVDAYA